MNKKHCAFMKWCIGIKNDSINSQFLFFWQCSVFPANIHLILPVKSNLHYMKRDGRNHIKEIWKWKSEDLYFYPFCGKFLTPWQFPTTLPLGLGSVGNKKLTQRKCTNNEVYISRHHWNSKDCMHTTLQNALIQLNQNAFKIYMCRSLVKVSSVFKVLIL